MASRSSRVARSARPLTFHRLKMTLKGIDRLAILETLET